MASLSTSSSTPKKKPVEWDPFLEMKKNAAGPHPKATRKRIRKDIKALFKSPLPGIVAYPDENNLALIHCLINGTSETPYEGGFFYFVLFFPPTYPSIPPRCRLMTTGGGTVRFNPNLYKNGKVCLSILGTWSGPAWSPVHTLSSVLLSIQSLLCTKPYHNEPGFQQERRSGDAQKYNTIIQHETLRIAVAGMLSNPPPTMPIEFVNMIKSIAPQLGSIYHTIIQQNKRIDGNNMIDPFHNQSRGIFQFNAVLDKLIKLEICTEQDEKDKDTRDNNAMNSTKLQTSNTVLPIILFLVGPKGSGKTTILQYLIQKNQQLYHFCPSETLFLKAQNGVTADIYQKEGTSWVDSAYTAIACNIKDAIAAGSRFICCESTGTPLQFKPFVNTMQREWGSNQVLLVHISATEMICQQRIGQRSTTNQLLIDSELVAQIYSKSMRLIEPCTESTNTNHSTNETKDTDGTNKTESLQITDFALILDSSNTTVKECSKRIEQIYLKR